MVPPYIILSSPSRPQALSDFSPVSGFGGHSQIMIRPTLLTGHHKALRKGERYAEGRFLFVADALLHETIHRVLILVDQQQVESLDTWIEVKPETEVTFLKLVALVGG